MARKLARRWKGDFRRALARTGNVRVAARAAGVDPGTAYDHRIKDADFAAGWERALAKARERARGPLHRSRAANGPPPSPPSRGQAGEELIARRSKRHGVQMVRAAHGRWSGRAEAAFLAELARTGCVLAGARACRMSTTTLYRRRKNYAEFADRWAAAEAQARERIPKLLAAAAIASLDPEVEEEGLPTVDIGQAIAICRIKGMAGGAPASPAAGRNVPEAPPIEAVRASILARLDAIEAHEKGKAPEGE